MESKQIQIGILVGGKKIFRRNVNGGYHWPGSSYNWKILELTNAE